MTPHHNFHHWLIIDWIEQGERQWKFNDDEDIESFLLVTPAGRRWVNAQPLNLPEVGFILVILLDPINDLTGEGLKVDNLPSSVEVKLPVWCHYGGLLSFQEVGDRWRRFNWLNKSMRDELTRRLPAPYPYPIPISHSHSLDWDSGWQEAKKLIRTYQPSKWDELVEQLNKVWAEAVRKISADAEVFARNRWVNAAQAVERLQAILPNDEDAPQLAAFLEEASSLGLSQLSPPADTEELEVKLSAKFKAALCAIDALSADLGHVESHRLKHHVESIHTALQDFMSVYEK